MSALVARDALVPLSVLIACDALVAVSALNAWAALLADGTFPSVPTLMLAPVIEFFATFDRLVRT